MLVADRGSAEGLPVDDAAQQRPARRRGFFGEFAAAVKRGSAMPMSGAPPAGRAARLGLVPVPPGGGQAEALPSRIVHGGRRHTIGGELAGDWDGRPAIVCDLHLDTDYGSRGDALPGIVSGRFHIAAVGLRHSYPWYAISRQDVREHLEGAGNGTRPPGAGMLGGVRLLADRGAPPLPAPVLEWVSRDAIARRTGHAQVSAIELAGPWALAVLPVAAMEHSDEHAAALATRLGRPELAPWPEQLLGLLKEFAGRLE
jgi:hypothetical protein